MRIHVGWGKPPPPLPRIEPPTSPPLTVTLTSELNVLSNIAGGGATLQLWIRIRGDPPDEATRAHQIRFQ